MKITVSKGAGFCPGVRHADEIINELIQRKENGERIYTLGSLIHNRLYNENLKTRGVSSIEFDDIERILFETKDKVTLAVRTHGIPREQMNFLLTLKQRYQNFDVCDLTCPYVKRIHKIAEENTNENTIFILFGSVDHPEVKGIMSYAKGEKVVISSLKEAESLDLKNKIPILCSQTTQNLLEFKKIKKFLKNLCTNSIFFDTICSVTENRQNEAIKIAKNSDVMIVIGGKESSNTHRLYELCQNVCSDTRWIESYEELLTDFPDNADCVGITAGASTPDGIIMEVLKLWKKTKM